MSAPFTNVKEVVLCMEKSNYLIAIYNQFNKQKIKDIVKLEQCQ